MADPGLDEPVAPGWRVDAKGKEYIPRQSGKGILYRQGEETIEEALARDAVPRDERPPRPRRKSAANKQMPKQPPPTKMELKELEALLTQAFTSPAAICAVTGDEWAVDHFRKAGPGLARNLVTAAEQDPWLRKKLEEFVTGGELATRFLSLMSVAGAVVVYTVPPLLYFTSIPLPAARAMFQVPPRPRRVPAPPPTEGPIPT